MNLKESINPNVTAHDNAAKEHDEEYMKHRDKHPALGQLHLKAAKHFNNAARFHDEGHPYKAAPHVKAAAAIESKIHDYKTTHKLLKEGKVDFFEKTQGRTSNIVKQHEDAAAAHSRAFYQTTGESPAGRAHSLAFSSHKNAADAHRKNSPDAVLLSAAARAASAKANKMNLNEGKTLKQIFEETPTSGRLLVATRSAARAHAGLARAFKHIDPVAAQHHQNASDEFNKAAAAHENQDSEAIKAHQEAAFRHVDAATAQHKKTRNFNAVNECIEHGGLGILAESKPISHQLVDIIKHFAKQSTGQAQKPSIKKKNTEVGLGSRVMFMHKPKEGKSVEVHGSVVHDHGDGSFNVDVSNPFMKGKAAPVRLNKKQLKLIESDFNFTDHVEPPKTKKIQRVENKPTDKEEGHVASFAQKHMPAAWEHTYPHADPVEHLQDKFKTLHNSPSKSGEFKSRLDELTHKAAKSLGHKDARSMFSNMDAAHENKHNADLHESAESVDPMHEGYDFLCKICGKPKSAHTGWMNHKYTPQTEIKESIKVGSYVGGYFKKRTSAGPVHYTSSEYLDGRVTHDHGDGTMTIKNHSKNKSVRVNAKGLKLIHESDDGNSLDYDHGKEAETLSMWHAAKHEKFKTSDPVAAQHHRNAGEKFRQSAVAYKKGFHTLGSEFSIQGDDHAELAHDRHQKMGRSYSRDV